VGLCAALQGQQLVAGGGGSKGPFRVSLQPGPANSATIAQSARRVLGNVNVQYVAAGQVARRLGVSHRTLGRVTGNLWVQAGEERRDRVDVGLCVRSGGKGLYVPDYARPLLEGGEAKGGLQGLGECTSRRGVHPLHLGGAVAQGRAQQAGRAPHSHLPMPPTTHSHTRAQAGRTARRWCAAWRTTAAASPGCGPPWNGTPRQVCVCVVEVG
jgi:hypothetical protein